VRFRRDAIPARLLAWRLAITLAARFANDDFGAVEREVVELHVAALLILVRPGCADLGPVALVAVLPDRIDAVRRP
jgi:hypothetical protein